MRPVGVRRTYYECFYPFASHFYMENTLYSREKKVSLHADFEIYKIYYGTRRRF